MKTLVFSDSHLGPQFEEHKYRFLLDLINKADQVIINGDFWEGYLYSFEQFIESPWKHLFPSLKQKKTVYIYGNHDKQLFSNDDVNLFSDIQTLRYEMPANGNKLIFEHGHRIVHFFEHRMKHPRPSKFISRQSDNLEKIMIRKLGPRFVHQFTGRLNKVIKKQIKEELTNGEIFFCGHTHCAEVDWDNNFINTGIIKFGLGQYAWIEDGRLTTKEEWYE